MSSKNYLDRYTSIDELLRENIMSTRELAEQQQMTNKLLYAQIKALAALPQGNISPQALIQGISPSEMMDIQRNLSGVQYRSMKRQTSNEVISGKKTVMTLKDESGIIAEILFLTAFGTTTDANTVFGVRIISDGETMYEDTFTNYQVSSNYETDMTAFYDSSYNCLQFQNIAYEHSIHVEVYSSTATFTRIYVKYHKKL